MGLNLSNKFSSLRYLIIMLMKESGILVVSEVKERELKRGAPELLPPSSICDSKLSTEET